MDAEKISKLRIVHKEGITPKRRINLKYLMAGLLTVLLIGALAVLYEQGILTPATSVQITSVSWVFPSQIITDFNASGYVVAQRRASVASKGTGRLEYLGVKEGSRVREGEVLARLESADLVAEKAQIEAQLAAAKSEVARAETDLRTTEKNYRRFQSLVDAKAVSQSNYESSENQYLRARATLDSARANVRALEAALQRSIALLDYTTIRAPFDGVVLTKEAEVGEVVAPFGSATTAKAAVVTMADPASLMVQADVAESFISRVREGQPCEIQLDSLPDTRFPGSVATIVPTAERAKGTVLVKVRFDNLDPRILPEMSAKVAFLSRPLKQEEAQPVLAVHRDAMTERDGEKGVFSIGNDRAEWVPLSNPVLFGDYILMAGSMREGERVVLKPPEGLSSGDRIKVLE